MEAAIKLGINNLGSSEETMMMFYMLHRIISFNDNEFTIDELSRLFDDPLGLNDVIFDAMRKGESTLQEKGLVEHPCEDGLENREAYQIPQRIQDELLAKGINQTLHRIYLDLKCNVSILTPFESSKQSVSFFILNTSVKIISD